MLYADDLAIDAFVSKLTGCLGQMSPALHVALRRVTTARADGQLAGPGDALWRDPGAALAPSDEAETFQRKQDDRREVVVEVGKVDIFGGDAGRGKDLAGHAMQT